MDACCASLLYSYSGRSCCKQIDKLYIMHRLSTEKNVCIVYHWPNLVPLPSPFPKKKQPECFRQLPELLRRLPMFRRADDYRSKLNAKMASSAKSPLPPRPQSVPVLSQSMNSDLYSYRLLNSGFRSPLVRNISVVYQHLRSIYELISCFLVRCHQKVNSSVFARLIIDEKTVISGQYFN